MAQDLLNDDNDSGFDSKTRKSSSCSLGGNPESDSVLTCIFSSIQDALLWATQGRDPNLNCASLSKELASTSSCLEGADHIQVLCTGSLHLIGGVIGLTGSGDTDQ